MWNIVSFWPLSLFCLNNEANVLSSILRLLITCWASVSMNVHLRLFKKNYKTAWTAVWKRHPALASWPVAKIGLQPCRFSIQRVISSKLGYLTCLLEWLSKAQCWLLLITSIPATVMGGKICDHWSYKNPQDVPLVKSVWTMKIFRMSWQ